MMSRADAPFAEFLVMSPDGTEIVPMFTPLLVDEPVPDRGRIRLSDRPGFGVEVNRNLPLERPFAH
jgi:L-rhamnonate dehydratase